MSAKEKEEIKRCLYGIIEVLDDQIPMVGRAMDLPIVDSLEKRAVDAVVDVLWDAPCHVDLSEDALPWSM